MKRDTLALFDELAEAVGLENAKRVLVILNGERITLATVERSQAYERFLQIRNEGWTQRRMARECGVDHHTIQRWVGHSQKTRQSGPPSSA